MQTSHLTCPFCNSTLNFGMTIAAGSPVECMICMQTFVAETTYVPDVSTNVAIEATVADSASPVSVAPGVPAAKPRPVAVEAIIDRPKAAPKKKPTRPALKRPAKSANTGRRLGLIAVAAGLFLLVAGGGGVAVWKLAKTPRIDLPADPVPPIALTKQAGESNKSATPAPTKVDTQTNKQDDPPVGNTEDEEERQRALAAAKTLLTRKSPVQIAAKEPEFAPIVPVGVRAQFPWGVDQSKIDEAIAKGVFYLKKNQNPNGTWAGNHGVGHASIGGLTLLECGAPADDFFVQRSAAFVRKNVANLNATYELSLAILFLDRLGDPRDRSVIQGLSLRLLGGQLDGGGWTYHCALLDPQEMFQLYAFLQTNKQPNLLNPLGGSPKLPSALAGKPPLANPLGQNPPLASPLGQSPVHLDPAFKQFGDMVLKQGLDEQRPRSSPLSTGIITGVPDPKGTANKLPIDNKTADKKPADEKPKFEALAPTKKPKAKAAAAIRPEWLKQSLQGLPVVKNQAAKKGKGKGKGGGGPGDNSNTQFAILALWAARRHNVPTDQALLSAYQRFADSQNGDGGWGYHVGSGSSPSMTCVGLLGEAMGHGVNPEIVGNDPNNPKAVILKPALQDPKIQLGVKALGRSIGEPSLKERGFPMENLYYLWSVERVAMLYDLKTIDGKDWYGWGAQILVHNQDASGAWPASNYHGASPPLNTCFALLFLKRSNLVGDLTSNLRLQAAIRE